MKKKMKVATYCHIVKGSGAIGPLKIEYIPEIIPIDRL
jgi:hypothetical protein